MAGIRDRRAAVIAQTRVNGIDYVEVCGKAQTQLVVHFLTASLGEELVKELAKPTSSVTITGGESIPEVAVKIEGWDTDAAGRPKLRLTADAPGDFSTYTLRLVTRSPLLDPWFDHAEFSFKARLPSTLDGKAPEPVPPRLAETAPPIDYLAKDFQSFCKALSEFSALRYPAWQERSEADFGVMFMEALASLADDLSYQQDRIAAEAWLETATERRSLVRLARLVDYEPRAATTARAWLAFVVAPPGPVSIPVGVAVSAFAADGASIDFETGTGLDDDHVYLATPEWNELRPYWWDDAQRYLVSGSTEMWIEAPSSPLTRGLRLLIDIRPPLPGDPPVREIVELVAVDDAIPDPLSGVRVVHVAWRAEDALRFEHDLAETTLCANVVPATEGRRMVERFTTSRASGAPGSVPRAIVRTGANGTLQFLHSLSRGPLAWVAQGDPGASPSPDLRVDQLGEVAQRWQFCRNLLDAGPVAEVFTVDPVCYRALGDSGVADYDGSDGDTLRFGDGVFGAVPGDGAVFEVRYRCGGGARGNVIAKAIHRIDPGHPIAAQVVSVTNPLPATGGCDAESAAHIREMAPQAFRARQYRAVRAEDYQQAAMTMPWVQRAGTTFRHTGSWLTAFTAVDPRGSESLLPAQAADLTELLNRYRLAGYESYVLPPRYASLDLVITVSARSDAFRGDVQRDVLAALDAGPRADGSLGFFHPDHFSFGTALERSAIEATTQDVPGVEGVVDVSYRRRGHTPRFVAMPSFVPVARDEIVRVDNDPKWPERGSLRITVVGGK